jgi:hypothetical protein
VDELKKDEERKRGMERRTKKGRKPTILERNK